MMKNCPICNAKIVKDPLIGISSCEFNYVHYMYRSKSYTAIEFNNYYIYYNYSLNETFIYDLESLVEKFSGMISLNKIKNILTFL